jgi:membrane associated rhomboid family serine protease
VFPYKADVMMRRLPWANWAIMAVTVLVSLVVMFAIEADTADNLALWTPNIDAQVSRISRDADGEDRDYIVTFLNERTAAEGFSPLQLLTHSLVHEGLWHLFGNMIFLFVFGNAVNAKIGHLPYVALYVGLALLSGAAWLAFPADGLYMVGASGAVMGMAGAFAVMYPLNEISFFTLLWLTPIVFAVRSVWVLLVYFILDMLGFLGGSADGVAHVSHLTGVILGAATASVFVLVGIAMPSAGEKTLLEVLRFRVRRDEPYERKIEVGANRGPAMAMNPNAPRTLIAPGAPNPAAPLRPQRPSAPLPPLN